MKTLLWCAVKDLNFRPPDYESGALTFCANGTWLGMIELNNRSRGQNPLPFILANTQYFPTALQAALPLDDRQTPRPL